MTRARVVKINSQARSAHCEYSLGLSKTSREFASFISGAKRRRTCLLSNVYSTVDAPKTRCGPRSVRIDFGPLSKFPMA